MAAIAPELVPGDRIVGMAEEFELGLLELATAEREVARRDLVAKAGAGVADAERHADARGIDGVLELNEDALRINTAGICQLYVQPAQAELKISSVQKNIIYRLLQEFVQNSLKHSRCRHIRVSFEQVENELRILAADDGSGFDTNAAATGIGLQNMQRRAAGLNAALTINSETGKGTSLLLQVPLNQTES